MMSTASDRRIQSRPTIRLAIGDLSPVEQDHVRISLRIISPRLQVPCVAVEQQQADITMKPSSTDAGNLSLISRFGERQIDRPLRLVPLSDALSELISRMLEQEGGITDGPADPAGPTNPQDPARQSTRVFDLLLASTQDQACHVVLQSGITFGLDRRRHSAYFNHAADLQRINADDNIASCQPVADGQLEHLRDTTPPDASIQVEQLVWMLANGNDVPQQLRSWLDRPDDILTLTSWPNLSRQPDALAWIQILADIFGRSMSVNTILQLAGRAGIPSQRARFGITLLCLFRHATLTQPTTLSFHVPSTAPPPPAPVKMNSNQVGLLSRLRNKLRSLLS